jgi:hypothetical protein
MEEEGVSRVSRRRLVKRLGIGTAVAWVAPLVTSFGTRAEAGECGCAPCFDDGTSRCDRICGDYCVCGQGCGPHGTAYCSRDVDQNCFCWQNMFCSEVSDCTENSDCPPGYACVPNTCGETPKCMPACGIGPRSRRRHGLMANGEIR